MRRQYSVGRMGALSVVVCQPFLDPRAGVRASFKCIEIDAFIFQGPPKPFDHSVINPAPTPVHGYLHIGIFQRLYPIKAGELAALIAVHDLRLALFGHRLFQGLNAKLGIHTV
jgi:hypothetical protein